MNYRKLMSVVVIAALLLAGCTPEANSEVHTRHSAVAVPAADDVCTLVMWHYYNGAQKLALDKMVDAFNRTAGYDSGIFVDAKSTGSIGELSEELVTAAAQGMGVQAMPNLFTAYADMASRVECHADLLNFDAYVDGERLSELVPSFVEEGRYGADGALKIYPLSKAIEILIVNTSAWESLSERAALTFDDLKTWESLQSTAELYYQLTDGRAFFARDALANYFTLGSAQLGNPIFTKGAPTGHFDRKTLLKLWDAYYTPYVLGYYNLKSRYASDDVKTGHIVALVTSMSSLGYLPDTVVEDGHTHPARYTILSVPTFKNTPPIQLQQGAGISAIHSSDARVNQAAVAFVLWMTEIENNIPFAASSASLPVHKLAFEDPDFVTAMVSKTPDVSEYWMDCYEIARRMYTSNRFYYPRAIDNGYETRAYLQEIFNQYLQRDRAAFVSLLENDVSFEAAKTDLGSNSRFTLFYRELLKTITLFN